MSSTSCSADVKPRHYGLLVDACPITEGFELFEKIADQCNDPQLKEEWHAYALEESQDSKYNDYGDYLWDWLDLSPPDSR